MSVLPARLPPALLPQRPRRRLAQPFTRRRPRGIAPGLIQPGLQLSDLLPRPCQLRGGLVRSEAGEAGHDAASVPGRSATTLPAAPAAALAAGSAANRAWGPCRNAAAPPSPAGTSTGSCSVPAARMPLTVRYDGSPAAAALAQAASSRPGWCLPAGGSTPCAGRPRGRPPGPAGGTTTGCAYGTRSSPPLCGIRARLSRPGARLGDFDDGEQRRGERDAELPRCGPGWCRHVGEMLQELVQGGLAVVDGGTFVVGEGNGDEHPLQVGPGLQELPLGGVLRGVEVTLGAGHPVRALLEEGIAADRKSTRLNSSHLGIS